MNLPVASPSAPTLATARQPSPNRLPGTLFRALSMGARDAAAWSGGPAAASLSTA